MKQILIVEDKANSRELLRVVLENLGHAVMEAGNGEQALFMIRNQTPDLVLLDLHLPVRSGYEVLSELRTHAQSRPIPVVALTASAMQGDREKALAAGFNGYLAKPVGLAELRNEVNRLLGISERSSPR